MPPSSTGLFLVLCLIPCSLIETPGGDAGPVAHGAGNLVRGGSGSKASISVDSCFSGYRAEVLSDGKWIEPGKEVQHEFGHPDTLGNGGNTWASADTEAEHWIRVDWPQEISPTEVEIWWSRDEWLPRAFRIEALREGKWVSVSGPEPWLAATARQSVIPLTPIRTHALRVVQPQRGGGSRNLMAAQEVLVFERSEGIRPRSGVRRVFKADLRRIEGRHGEHNLARLDAPGATSVTIWLSGGEMVPAPWLADGDIEHVPPSASRALSCVVSWPIAHVIDGVSLAFPGDAPNPATIAIEVDDGIRWVPVQDGLRAERAADRRRLKWSFEPMATRGVRARWIGTPPAQPASEMEVHRYLPAAKDVWPPHLVQREGVKQQILAGDREPTFESLALCALPMTPARALLGIKDAPHEIGVTWDGTLIARDTLRFRFGPEQECLGDCRDTVTRHLIGGWYPGVIVQGRLGPLAVRETAFVAPPRRGPAALWVRIELENVGGQQMAGSILVEMTGKEAPDRFEDSALLRQGRVVLLSKSPCQAEQNGRGLRVDVALKPGQTAHADFVYPQDAVSAGPALDDYRSASFEEAYAAFRDYWDGLLRPAAAVEVPEPRIHRMFKAVLAQLFINADGDIMCYGSAPSAYEGDVFGVEEGYAMLALALAGFGHDAQRYLAGTYLNRDFLKKVERYSGYADRHQQYRNGLAPHYAVSVYRLTRDTEWIRKYLPLLRECAEWTIAQRQKTMVPSDKPGEEPLHWGLLPAWSYGGDIADVQCYALYANYACWRGLVDTAWLLEELGDADAARRYAEEARQYRAAIDRAVEASYRQDHQPPFLPLRLYADRPDEQMDYYQLFAGCLLDLEPFEKGSRHFRWIADFLEQDNRTFCFLPRFRRDAGAGGLDAIYSKGYLLSKLHEDHIRDFLLGFYAFLAFNMDHETFASRETNVLYASDLHAQSAYQVPDMSDPLPCSSAVALHFLRHMLVTEERAGPGQYSGNLLLLPAVPKAWLADGCKIRIAEAPTHFGPVSLEVRSAAASGRIEARVVPPQRHVYGAIKLRLRHPQGKAIRSVTLDGKPWQGFDAAGSWIVLPGGTAVRHLVVTY